MGKAGSFPGQIVQMRCFDDWVPITSQSIGTMVIGNYQHNIRFTLPLRHYYRELNENRVQEEKKCQCGPNFCAFHEGKITICSKEENYNSQPSR